MKLYRQTKNLGLKENPAPVNFVHHKSNTDFPRIKPKPSRWKAGD